MSVLTNCSGSSSRRPRSPARPTAVTPFGSVPAASTGSPASVTDRHSSDGVVVLQHEARRIDHSVTARARGIAPVQLQALAHRRRRVALAALRQRRHVGRRTRRRRPEDRFQQPPPAQDGRGAVRVGGQRQQRSMAQQPAALLQVGQRHAPEPAPVDPGDAVVARQPLVQVRVVGGEQVQDAAVLVERAADERRRLLPEGLHEVLVELGI